MMQQPFFAERAGILDLVDTIALLDHQDVVAKATADQAGQWSNHCGPGLFAVDHCLRSLGIRISHLQVGLEKTAVGNP